MKHEHGVIRFAQKTTEQEIHSKNHQNLITNLHLKSPKSHHPKSSQNLQNIHQNSTSNVQPQNPQYFLNLQARTYNKNVTFNIQELVLA